MDIGLGALDVFCVVYEEFSRCVHYLPAVCFVKDVQYGLVKLDVTARRGFCASISNFLLLPLFGIK
jgi:hypothetical protein